MSLEDAIRRLRGDDRPLPWVTVGHGRWVPGWAFRAVFVLAVPALVLMTASRTTASTGFVATLAVVLTAWAVARPGPGTAHGTVIACALVLLGSPGPFDPAALALAPAGYAVVRLGWWTSHVRWRTHVELAALAHAGARDAVVIGATAAVGALGWAVAGHPMAALVALGTAALAAVAWLALRRDDGASRESS